MAGKSAEDSTHGFLMRNKHLQFCEGHGMVKFIVRPMQVKWENINGYTREEKNLKSQLCTERYKFPVQISSNEMCCAYSLSLSSTPHQLQKYFSFHLNLPKFLLKSYCPPFMSIPASFFCFFILHKFFRFLMSEPLYGQINYSHTPIHWPASSIMQICTVLPLPTISLVLFVRLC